MTVYRKLAWQLTALILLVSACSWAGSSATSTTTPTPGGVAPRVTSTAAAPMQGGATPHAVGTLTVPKPYHTGGVEAVLVRESHLWSGPETTAIDFGTRPIGTPITVFRVAGDRLNIIEFHDPAQAAWIDIADVAMSRADWDILRPSPIETTLVLCLPPSPSVPASLTARATSAAADFVEAFVSEGAPAIRMLIRTGYGGDTVGLDVSINKAPSHPERMPVPDCSKFDRNCLDNRAKIERANKDLLAEYSQAMASLRAQAQGFGAKLRGLAPVSRANTVDCVGAASRELSQGSSPVQSLVLLTGLAEAAPSALPAQLSGIRVTLLVYCSDSQAACQATESLWVSSLRKAGAMSVRNFDATGAYIQYAFEAVSPVIR